MFKTKTKSKLISMLVALVMVLQLLPLTAIPVYAAVPDASGEGTSSSPRIVHDFAQLKEALEHSTYTHVTLNDTGSKVTEDLPLLVTTGVHAGIEVNGTKTLTVNGEYNFAQNYNASSSQGSYDSLIAINAGDSLTINGSGSLAFSPSITNGQNSVIRVDGGTLTVDGTLEIRGEPTSFTTYGRAITTLSNDSTVSLKDATLTGVDKTTITREGIATLHFTVGGNLNIDNCTIRAIDGRSGVTGVGYGMIITNSALVSEVTNSQIIGYKNGNSGGVSVPASYTFSSQAVLNSGSTTFVGLSDTITITAQPSKWENGNGVSITATSTLGGLTYQWYYNDTDSTSGGTMATGSTAQTANYSASAELGLPAADYYLYCVVSDKSGHSVTSNTVLFNIAPTVDTYTTEVTPTFWSFGSVNHDYGTSAPSAKTITIKNTGTGTITGLNIPDVTGYTITDPVKTSLAKDESTTFTVRPNGSLSSGVHDATLSIEHNTTGETFSIDDVHLQFTVNSATLNATVSDAQLDFGTKEHGYTERPTAQTITITNTGTGTIEGLSVTAPTGYEIVTALSKTTIAPNATATFSVRPKADLAAGGYLENLTIGNTSGAVIPSVYLTFRVNSPTLTYTSTVSPKTLDFGTVEYGYGVQPAQEITITNTGTGIITGLTATSISSDFEIVTGLSTTTLAPNGGTATFTVRPKTNLAAGTYNNTISINALGVGIDDVSLKFVVNSPTYTNIVSPTTLNFGTVEYGYGVQPAKEVTITNNGTGNITGFSATIPTGYELVGDAPNATITANGGKVTFSVRPETGLDAGNKDATISFTNGSGATIDDVSLKFVVTKDKAAPPSVTFTATGTDTGEFTGSSLTNLSYTINNSTGIGSDVPSDGILTDTLANGDIIRVYTKGDGTNIAHSDAQVIYVTQAYLPSGINKSDATTDTATDGSIIGLSSNMEYSTDGGTTWDDSKIVGTSITGLKKNDTYLVRVKANGAVLASESVSITIGAKEITYGSNGIQIGTQGYELSNNSNTTNPALPSGLTWNHANRTITMNGYNGTEQISINTDVNLHLVGTNSINIPDATVQTIPFNTSVLRLRDTIITADSGASLSIDIPDTTGDAKYLNAIFANGTLQILSGDITVTFGDGDDTKLIRAIFAIDLFIGGNSNVTVTIDNASNNRTEEALAGNQNVTLSTSGTVTATANNNPFTQGTKIIGTGTYIANTDVLVKEGSVGRFPARMSVQYDASKYDVAAQLDSVPYQVKYTFKASETSPTINSVIVSPNPKEFVKADLTTTNTEQFSAIVSGTAHSQDVIWTVLGRSEHSTTSISPDGLLTVDDSELAPTLTVVATSAQDPSVQGIATVTITGNSPSTESLTGTVHINGLPRVNETLQAVVNASNYTGALQYKWYHSDNLSGTPLGTNNTYLVKPADLGKGLVVVVTSTLETGSIERYTSTIQAATAPPAPTELGVKAPTASGGDGKITGTKTTMEYATNSAFTDATDATATETLVAPGTYYVRFKANGGVDASAYISVTVPNYTAPISYSAEVTPDGKVFTSAEVGYGPQTAQLFTINNDGSGDLANVNVTISGTDFTLTTTGMATSLVPTASTTFSVVPNGSLSEGKHTATITISADSMTDITKVVSFTVTGAPGTYHEITFDANGGTPVSPATDTTVGGKLSTLPTTTRSGYTFDGWFTAATGGTRVTTATTFTANTTIYAQWTANSTGGGGGGGSTPDTPSEEAVDDIAKAKPGDTVELELSGSKTTVDKEVFEELAGKDITLDIVVGDVVWTVHGKDIPEDADFSDIDFGVKVGSNTIPATVINQITGMTTTVQISIEHDGEFGFPVKLTVDLGGDNEGYYANLFYYNETADELEFRQSVMIPANGKTEFDFTGASDYVFLISERDMDMKFTDVAEDDWFYGDVMYVYQNGIMAGVSETAFDPNGTATRAMIATVLHRMEGTPEVELMYADFSDVVQGEWYEAGIAWAAKEEVAVGVGEGLFAPNMAITREQLVTMLYRYAGSPVVDGMLNYADDDSVSDWAYDAMIWAVDVGIIQGKTETTLNPKDTATRAEIAAIMHRFMEMK